jgi:serine O-acetyltransferase
MGRAVYSDRFYFYQGCTIGGSNGKYPVLGENVILYSNATILGDSKIGNNVIIGTGTTAINEIIPDNCLVFGQSPNLVVKQKSEEYIFKKTEEFWQ